MKLLFHSALCAVATALTAPSTHAAAYKATLLAPTGYSNSRAYGVWGSSQVGVGFEGDSPTRAFLWSAPAGTPIDLTPPGYAYSTAMDVSGTHQIGSAWGNGHGDTAFLWNGTASSGVALTPTGFNASYAFHLSDSSQVGYGVNSATQAHHALLWYGSAQNAVDLHPAGFAGSEASAVDGNSQVGQAYNDPSGAEGHAILWSGSAASAVDLNPAGFASSRAQGISGDAQVGYGYTISANSTHALLWHGDASSVVDLNPPGFVGSMAQSISGDMQVGSAYGPTAPGHGHAMLWAGTPDSAIDLHSFLNDLGQTFSESVAQDITAGGSIVGYARTANGSVRAVLWTPIPEPASAALAACAILIATLLHRARQRGTGNPVRHSVLPRMCREAPTRTGDRHSCGRRLRRRCIDGHVPADVGRTILSVADESNDTIVHPTKSPP